MNRRTRLGMLLTSLALLVGAGLARTYSARTSAPDDRAPGAPGSVTFQTTGIAIPTFNFQPSLQIRSTAPYTYHWLDWGNYTADPIIPVTYTLLVIENDYIRVTLLPELGGRIYQMIWKPTGNNELYQNPVIKPTTWGPAEQGWWLAVGGIEWGLPVDEHGYEWGEPWEWSVVTCTAGVTVTVRDTWATDRVRAAIDITLLQDRAFVQVSPHLENPTLSDLSVKFWSNAMLAPGPANTVGPDLRWIFNSDEMAVHSTGDDRHFDCAGPTRTSPDCVFSWPIYAGVDFSRLGNWREWLGFFEYPQAAADFIGVYDTSAQEGVARVFPSAIARGAKGFGMGRPNSGYQLPPGLWTDDESTYAELHGGAAPAFWDSAVLTAGTTLDWQEFWYPVSAIGLFSSATSEAALSFQQAGDTFNIGLHSTIARAASDSKLYVWESATCTPLAQWDVAIDPAHPFVTSLPANGRTADQVSVMYLDGAGRQLATIRPITCLAPEAHVEPLPPIVETTTFTVTWVRPEQVNGLGTFQVQVRDGDEGEWTDWLAGTNVTASAFAGEHGHRYFFRARTSAPNQSGWGNAEWQAFTTVLTQPAPVLITSRKAGEWSTLMTLTGTEMIRVEVISYNVLISNTGNLEGNVILTDVTSSNVVLLADTLTVDGGPPPAYAEGNIVWNGAVTEGASVQLNYALAPTVTLERGDHFTNTITIEGSVLGPITRQVVTVYPWLVWLPIVTR
jgi:uncharacterized repeat protein (TIGR01451 family)